MTSKEEDEHFYVAAFMEAVGLRGSLEPQRPGEGPDFALVSSTGRYGVEVTRIVSPDNDRGISLRQLEGKREQVLNGAKAIWDRTIGVNIEVHVHWEPSAAPPKSSIADTAQKLADVAAANLPGVGSLATIEWSWRAPNGLPRGVSSISIVRLATYDRSYWVGANAAMIGELTPNLIQSRIDAKNVKVKQYRRTMNEVWLLLVLDSHNLSGMFELPDSVFEHRYSSAFDRTSLLDTFHRRTWDLLCVRPDPRSA